MSNVSAGNGEERKKKEKNTNPRLMMS